jgi:hypothetical protein
MKELDDHEFLGTCPKCQQLTKGAEIYDRERGWITVWLHAQSKSRLCLVA